MVELEPRTLLSGLVVGESPRWHDGRLWFANWGAAQEIRTVDLQGHSEVIAKGPKPAVTLSTSFPTATCSLLAKAGSCVARRTDRSSPTRT